MVGLSPSGRFKSSKFLSHQSLHLLIMVLNAASIIRFSSLVLSGNFEIFRGQRLIRIQQ
jgi:hypothetical protein